MSFLEASQSSDGSWGDPASTQLRDTAVAVDTFVLLGNRGGAYRDGLAAVSSYSTRNHDDIARQTYSLANDGQVTSTVLQELLDAQQGEVVNPAASGFPGRGWGGAAGFGATALDTALVLRALRVAGVPRGMSVVGEDVSAQGSSPAHNFFVPAGSSNLFLKVRELSSPMRFILTDPGGASYFSDIVPGVVPISIGPFPVAQGTWALSVQNTGVDPANYTAEVGFTDATGFDTFRVSTAYTYLGLSQNADGGWGLVTDGDSQLMITSEVTRTLATGGGVFPGVLVSARDWLLAHQNADGGFSSEGASNINETALAMLAIGLADPATPLDTAVGFLEAAQLANGSWADDPYQTASAMQALLLASPLASAPVIVSDGGAGAGENFITDRATETIEVTIGFGVADIRVVNASGSEIDIDLENGKFLISAGLVEGANSLVVFALDGFGRGMGEDTIVITRDSSLVSQEVLLGQGFNLVGLRVDPANPISAIGLLKLLGTEAQEIKRLDTATGTYQAVARSGAGFVGSDFPLNGLDSLIINAGKEISGHISGHNPVATTVDLFTGVNGLTIPNPPEGLDAFGLLSLIGNESVVSAIQHFNRFTGEFETAAYQDGIPTGINFPIAPSADVHVFNQAQLGTSYLVHMRQDVPGFVLPSVVVPTIQITNPVDGAVVFSSPLVVNGLASGEVPFTVTVNGVAATVVGNSFTASVPLILGPNALDAEIVDGGGRVTTDSITVTYDDLVDYTIAPGGLVTDSRVFTADPAVLDQIAFFTEVKSGVPPGVSYTTTGVARISATEIEVSFRIEVEPATAPGIFDFQIEYGLLDADSNPLGPLSGNLFDFRIEVTP